jgi:hypothetical protein
VVYEEVEKMGRENADGGGTNLVGVAKEIVDIVRGSMRSYPVEHPLIRARVP